IESAARGQSSRKSRSRGHEVQGNAINAVAQASRRRPVLQDMAEMPSAAAAVDLRAGVNQLVVGRGADCARNLRPEARPAGAAVIFGLGRIERQVAARAVESAFAVLVEQRTREGMLRSLLPKDVELLRC